jgi:hypothetical protein
MVVAVNTRERGVHRSQSIVAFEERLQHSQLSSTMRLET